MGYWAVEFEVEGWLASFREATAVTTQTTHTIPPKSALLGFLFAKIGIGRSYFRDSWPDIYKEYIKKVNVAVAFNNKKKVSFFDYVLYLNAGGKGELKPTFIEYLVWPKYTFIYLLPEEDKYFGKQNKEAILNNEMFKVSLGSNEAPAQIRSAREIRVNEKEAEKINTKFIIESRFVDSIDATSFNNSISFIKEYVPLSSPNENFNVSEFIVPIGDKMSLNLKSMMKVYIRGENEFIVI
jgi:CRISPR-associated protein Cas5 subtype I-B